MQGSPNKKVKLENNNDFTEVLKLCLMHIHFKSEFISKIYTLSNKVHAFLKKYFFIFRYDVFINDILSNMMFFKRILFIPNKMLRTLQNFNELLFFTYEYQELKKVFNLIIFIYTTKTTYWDIYLL